MDFKRIPDLSEAYRQAAHAKLNEAFSHSNYDISDYTETSRIPTINIVEDESWHESGAWVTAQVWIPKTTVRDAEVTYCVSFNQRRTVNIVASSADLAFQKFELGEWEEEDASDEIGAGTFCSIMQVP